MRFHMLIAFPIALALRIDRLTWCRVAGLAMGMVGVALIAAPGAAA